MGMPLLNKLYNSLPILMYFKYILIPLVGIYVLATRDKHDDVYVFWALEFAVIGGDVVSRLLLANARVNVTAHNIGTILYYVINLLNMVACLFGTVVLAESPDARGLAVWPMVFVLAPDYVHMIVFLSAIIYSVVFLTRLQ